MQLFNQKRKKRKEKEKKKKCFPNMPLGQNSENSGDRGAISTNARWYIRPHEATESEPAVSTTNVTRHGVCPIRYTEPTVRISVERIWGSFKVNFICTGIPFFKQEGGYLRHNSPLNRGRQREKQSKAKERFSFQRYPINIFSVGGEHWWV